MHLGEVPVIWDPGEWYGITSTGGNAELTWAVRCVDEAFAESHG
ncbi:hypothetical protein [Embleya sp. NBC_00896]|nr:hypothetical protein OG928_33440 [Embleya sp. NBC_00896]